MQDLKINLVQDVLHWENAAANRAHFTEILQQLNRPDLVLLPEMFNTGFTVHPERVAEEMDGPTIAWMREMAVSNGFALAGSLIIQEGSQYFNRLIFMHPDGQAQQYDKRHLFRMGGEDRHFGMGQKQLIVNYRNWRILPLICYDLRFPVWARNRYSAGQFAYDFAFYLANWPAARSHPWKSLLMARAIENQAFVAGLNRVGEDGEGIHYTGDSRVIDPKGEIIASADGPRATILEAVLSHTALQAFREKFQVALDWDRFSLEA
jgi:predicted amidohydrolase